MWCASTIVTSYTQKSSALTIIRFQFTEWDPSTQKSGIFRAVTCCSLKRSTSLVTLLRLSLAALFSFRTASLTAYKVYEKSSTTQSSLLKGKQTNKAKEDETYCALSRAELLSARTKKLYSRDRKKQTDTDVLSFNPEYTL